MELKEFQDTLTKWQGELETKINGLLKTSDDNTEVAKKALETELDGVKKSLNSVTEQLKTIEAKRIPGAAEELKKKPFDFGMAAAAMYKARMNVTNEPWKGAEYEKELFDARRKDNNASSGEAGGYLIPDEVSDSMIDMVTANMPLAELGMNIIKGLVGDLPVPKKTSRTTAYMVGENEKPTSSGVKYGEVTLRPKKAGAFSKQSNRLIYQSRGVSNKIIKDDLMYSMAKIMQEQALTGTGVGKNAKGLFTNSNFTTSNVSLGANGGRFRIDDASKMITDIECADEINNPGGKYGFLFHPRVKAGMKRERIEMYSAQTAGKGAPVLPMNLLMNDKVLSDQLGHKIAASTLVPANATVGTSSTCAKTVFGDWNLFWMGIWRDLVMKVSDTAGDGSTGSAFLDDQLYIVLFQEFDTALMREAAMTVATGCETTEANW
jgi:HK97 family phage major capsid protein